MNSDMSNEVAERLQETESLHMADYHGEMFVKIAHAILSKDYNTAIGLYHRAITVVHEEDYILNVDEEILVPTKEMYEPIKVEEKV